MIPTRKWLSLCMRYLACIACVELQGLLAEGKEGKRVLDRKTSEYDAARLKHLGHKSHAKPSKWRKGEDAEKIHSDMVAAQVSHSHSHTCVQRSLLGQSLLLCLVLINSCSCAWAKLVSCIARTPLSTRIVNRLPLNLYLLAFHRIAQFALPVSYQAIHRSTLAEICMQKSGLAHV